MSLSCPIDGVILKELITHDDSRGFFREILRVTDPFFDHPFGQWSHSFLHAGVLKAWHSHQKQTDYFYVAAGLCRVGLCDLRPGSRTNKATMDLLLGDGQSALVVKVPPGIAHGVKALKGPAHLLYLMSHTYDPDDEFRIPADSADIPFDWRQDPPLFK